MTRAGVPHRQRPSRRAFDESGYTLLEMVVSVGIMVVIQVRRGSIKTLGGVARVASLSDAEVVRQQVAEGLRAELKSSSPIAGQKSIDLDFHPEREARLLQLRLERTLQAGLPGECVFREVARRLRLLQRMVG